MDEVQKEIERIDEKRTDLIEFLSTLRAMVGQAVGERGIRPDDLIYAATERCICGAGIAYAKDLVKAFGSWTCSAVLMSKDGGPKEVKHTEQLPFAFYSIKSELQPSAGGMTTRPSPSE